MPGLGWLIFLLCFACQGPQAIRQESSPCSSPGLFTKLTNQDADLRHILAGCAQRINNEILTR